MTSPFRIASVHPLRRERELRGWSQGFVAEQIEAPAASYVSRWERGVTSPSPYYRERLCRLFQKNAEELGLLRAPEDADGQDTPDDGQRVAGAPRTENGHGPAAHAGLQPAGTAAGPADGVPGAGARAPAATTVQLDSRPARDAGPTWPRWRSRHRPSTVAVGAVAIALVTVVAAAGVLWATQTIPRPHSRTWPVVAYDIGVRSDQVRVVQMMLTAQGYYLGLRDPDGMFADRTQQALTAFQRANGLPVTGVVDDPTWERLVVTSSAGDRGPQVEALQTILRARDGQLPPDLVDGRFDARTTGAVRQFQQAHRLPPAGQADIDTWNLLVQRVGGIDRSCGPSIPVSGGTLLDAVPLAPGSDSVQLVEGSANGRPVLYARIVRASADDGLWMDWSDDAGVSWHQCTTGHSDLIAGRYAATPAVNAIRESGGRSQRVMRACGRAPGPTNACTSFDRPLGRQ